MGGWMIAFLFKVLILRLEMIVQTTKCWVFSHVSPFFFRPSPLNPGGCCTLTTSAISTGIVGCIDPRNMGSECPGTVAVLTCLGCWESTRADSIGICNHPKMQNPREGLLHRDSWEFKELCSNNSMFKFWILSIIGPHKGKCN